MKALELLRKMGRGEIPFEPVYVQGGVTQGRFIRGPPVPSVKNETVVKAPKGKDYSLKFRNELIDDFEEKELLSRFQESVAVKQLNCGGARMSSVDEATSLVTLDQSATVEDRNDVYKNYSFEDRMSFEAKNLLINEYRREILHAIDARNIVVIKGPTGCGKTTRVPLFILDDAKQKDVYCNIIVTQPRKIAATSVARRICDERGWALGTIVGYQIALEKKTHQKDTRLTFVTAGVLLRKLVNRQFHEYTHIIVDEVHERESETDFILIILKQLIKMNTDKKLILMSATMNSDKFVKYFSKKVGERYITPPVIDLPLKRTYGVVTFYLDDVPLIKPGQIDQDLNEPMLPKKAYFIASSLIEIFTHIDRRDGYDPSDGCAALIFLPGIVEIENMHEILEERNRNLNQKQQCYICTLHSSMSFEEQMKVFLPPPHGQRKVILSTNIAESSITVPDVKYVIDFCLTKRQVQEPDTCYSSLHLCWESKSQAEQRAGRAGRTMRGRVYRMVFQETFDAFEQDSPPEILHCPLDRLVLQAKQLDMGAPANILGRAMDPPDLECIERTILNLKKLGALTLQRESVKGYDEGDGDLTYTGQVMAELPLDTQLCKLILVGHMFSVLRECVAMACLMTGKGLFTYPLTKKMEVYNARIGWEDGSKSDPITALNVYQHWKEEKAGGTFNRSGGETEQQWARRNFVHLKVLREVEKLEVEVMQRLMKMEIYDVKVDLVKENKEVVPLILKVCLAGACFPNFFLTNRIDEEQAVKALGNRDPSRTVYFCNFALRQPGPLYRDVVKNLLEDCGSGLKVHFDESTKVYVEFESSMIPHEDSNLELDIPIPGKVMKAVYRAVQKRIFDIPMRIPLLDPRQAYEKASRIFGDQLYSSRLSGLSKKSENLDGSFQEGRPLKHLPLSDQTIVSLIVTQVFDPSNFYAVLEDERVTWIQELINDPREGVLVDLGRHELTVGTLCLAQYSEPVPGALPAWYRAKIIVVNEAGFKVQYIDFGNYEHVEAGALKGFGPKLLAQNIHKESPVALRCRLAEVQPKSIVGDTQWSKAASDCVRDACCYFRCDAKIYSVVKDSVALQLYPNNYRPTNFTLPVEESLNYLLVKNGLAKFVEEPYLSKEDHEHREKISKRKDRVDSALNNNDLQDFKDTVHIEPFEEMDIRKSLKLLGPFSPLEMKVFASTRKCLDKPIIVDSKSINSALINDNPCETMARLIVAGLVSQRQFSSSLTIRQTTMMPPIRGISGMLALLFSNEAELRISQDFTHYTGALCGLGCDSKGVSYDQENDVEITFDCYFDTTDIENMNKIRFWMDKVLCRRPNALDHLASGAGISGVQRFCVNYLIELLSSEKCPLSATEFPNRYEWNQLPADRVLCPNKEDTHVYKLILGASLEQRSREREIAAMNRHLEKLNSYVNWNQPMRFADTCLFCQHDVNNIRSLEFHLQTRFHKMRVHDFFNQPVDASKETK